MVAILDGESSSSEDEFTELDRTLEMVSTAELENLERTPSRSTPAAVHSPAMPIHFGGATFQNCVFQSFFFSLILSDR